MRFEVINKVGRYNLCSPEKQEMLTQIFLFDVKTIPLEKTSVSLFRKADSDELETDVDEAIGAIEKDIKEHIYDTDRKHKKAFLEFLLANKDEIRQGTVKHEIELLELQKKLIDVKIKNLRGGI